MCAWRSLHRPCQGDYPRIGVVGTVENAILDKQSATCPAAGKAAIGPLSSPATIAPTVRSPRGARTSS